MLRVVHGNRSETLLAALVEALPPVDPFAPSTVVIGGHLVGRWLTRELAFARGIAAGIELQTFDQFVETTWGTDEVTGLDRKQLAAVLASVLADVETTRALAPVASYLAAAPGDGDRAGPRRVQLAEHLAGLWWSYALTRPDWMPALLAGRVPGELKSDGTARWQAALIGAAMRKTSGAVPMPMLPWARRRARLGPPSLPRPVSVFGMSFLARAQLEALTDLSATTDVSLYLLDPCEELWDDVAGRRTESEDPLPLVLWGRPVRDTISALVDRTGGDLAPLFGAPGEAVTPTWAPDDRVLEPVVASEGNELLEFDAAMRAVRAIDEEVAPEELVDVTPYDTHPFAPAVLHARFAERHTDSARELLFADVRFRRAPGQTSGDAGVTIHACPNPRREIEVVAELARRALEEHPDLRAHEIAVWIAGDAEHYLAQAPAAFESAGVPCHLIDAPIDDRGRIGEAVLALLELPTSTMARRDLLRVMTHPAVMAGYPHADAEDWVRWTDRLGIAHGADGRAHDGTYLEEHRGQFHWDQGVRRLALGAFMTADRGPVRIAELTVEPEEVRPDQQASAATYALLVRSLCADAEWLARHEAPLAQWASVLAGLVDTYLANRSSEPNAARDHERVRAMLANLAHLDLDGRPVGFREVREHASRTLAAARSNRGEPLATGAMIAPLAAMRAVPARIVFVVGLDEGAFPAADRPSPLDLRCEIRPGDVSARDRDRAAFLEVLLGARDQLHLSYVAIEPKSGQALAPSSTVLELADALAPYLGAPSSREALAQITVRHPLHRFGDASDARPAVQRERWALAVRDRLRAHVREAGAPIPDEDGVLSLLGHASQERLRADLGLVAAPAPKAAGPVSRPITVSNLRTFLEHPVQAWAQVVLGLEELPDDSVADDSDEPFHLGRAERTVMLREVFAAQLREQGDVVARYTAEADRLTLKNQFPVGVFGEAARALDLRMLRVWREALGLIAVGGATRYGFGRASSPGAQLVPAVELELSGGRRVRIVGQTELLLRGPQHTSVITMIRKLEKRTPYHLRGAFDHVLLAAAGIATDGHLHRLIDRDGDSKVVVHTAWTQADARAYLTGLVTELLDGAHGYLLPFEALAKALTGGKLARVYGDPTSGLGYGPIDRLDGLEQPGDAPAFARRRLQPLVERMIGSDFEVAS